MFTTTLNTQGPRPIQGSAERLLNVLLTERERKRGSWGTHCVDKYVTNLLVDIPMIDSVSKAVEESLMEVVDFWNLVEDVLDKAGIGKTSCLRLFQRLQVNL